MPRQSRAVHEHRWGPPGLPRHSARTPILRVLGSQKRGPGCHCPHGFGGRFQKPGLSSGGRMLPSLCEPPALEGGPRPGTKAQEKAKVPAAAASPGRTAVRSRPPEGQGAEGGQPHRGPGLCVPRSPAGARLSLTPAQVSRHRGARHGGVGSEGARGARAVDAPGKRSQRAGPCSAAAVQPGPAARAVERVQKHGHLPELRDSLTPTREPVGPGGLPGVSSQACSPLGHTQTVTSTPRTLSPGS